MTPLVLYTASYQPNLLVGYTDFKSELALWLGYGFDSTNWTSDEQAELNRHIQEAYRWILYPQTIPGEKVPHTWSFMEQTTTLVTTADDYDYTLPADFGSFIGKYMYWGVGVVYDHVCRTNDSEIIHLRAFSETTARPERFALRWAAQVAGSSQRQELIFWPTPDTTYTLTYKYSVLIGPLSTTNPYPLGGPRISQLMLEACKAIGETKKNGSRGDQWDIFVTALKSAIELDSGTNTSPTMGFMRGAHVERYDRGTSGRASYYAGPYSDGSYVLEIV